MTRRRGIRAALRQLMPNSEIRVEGIGEGVVLAGTASSPIESQQAGEIAARLVGGADNVTKNPAEAKSFADLRNLKIRVLASPFQLELVRRMGGSPVAMTLGDVLPGLQQGAIDGAYVDLVLCHDDLGGTLENRRFRGRAVQQQAWRIDRTLIE